MRNNMVDRIIRAVEKYNHNLTVVQIKRYRFRYFVQAVHDIAQAQWEMDPFYLYCPLTNGIRGFVPTSNLRLFGKIIDKGKVLYHRVE